MTNKRFIFELVEICGVDNDILVEVITDKEKNYSYDELDEVVDLLNALHQENQELKQENDKYRVMINANASLNDEVYEQLKKAEKSYKECRKENEQLKGENNMLKIIIDRNESYIRRLTHQSSWHC